MARDGYYQQPALRGDTLVFVSEDDLWTVPAAGGTARRLTANPGRASAPSLSPDGALLAFTGRDEGGDEVYLMDAGGGPARRLTYLGARTRVVGWTPDGAVIFASDAAEAFAGYSRLYTVSPEGGTPVDLGVGHAVAIVIGEDGARVLARNAVDLAIWKRYRGGQTGDLWIDRDGDGGWRRLVRLPGNLASPMLLGARVWFASDHEGTANLYSCAPDGQDLTRHTDHRAFFVRHPSSDGRRVAYQAGADLYLLEPGNGAARRVAIDFASPRTGRARRFVDAARFLQHAALDPSGTRLAITARGQVRSAAPFDGPIEAHGHARHARQRLATFLHDGRLVAVSDASGEERLELYRRGAAAADGPERTVEADIGRPRALVASPTAPRLAIADHRFRLLLADVDAGEVHEIDRSSHGPMLHPTFSPDGAYLAYSVQSTATARTLRLFDVRDGSHHDLTEPVLADVSPSFDPEGRYLAFLGSRTFDPVYDEMQFDLGFPRGARPYLITLQRDAPSPLLPVEGGERAAAGRAADEEADEAGPAGAAGAPATVRVDLEGIARRVVALPVPLGRYGRVRAVKGKLLYTTFPIRGALDRNFLAGGPPPADGTLYAFDLATSVQEVAMEGVSDFEVSQDAGTVLVRSGNRLRVFAAAEKPPADGKAEPGRKSGWIDLGRLRISVDPPSEWGQILRETWALQRELFWNDAMSGVDWDAILRRYQPLITRVGSRSEVSDLLWEVQGELGTSHAYVLGGDLPPEPSYPQGFLGADLRLDPATGEALVAAVPRGDAWDAAAGSPLERPGVNVRPGDRVIAVDGQPLSAERPLPTHLVHRAGVAVRLTVRPADGGAPRDVRVETLADERPLRYRAWVVTNRRRVREASDGRLGYVHVPDMGPRGFSEFHRAWLQEAERDGLIVDVRFNGGGHVSELLLQKLARRRLAYTVARYAEPRPFPQHAVAGPLVALTNERAGSDGDIFSHLFKRMGLGPLVGTRTWGGVVGLQVLDRTLDGGLSTQPQVAFWFDDVGWRVENFGTEPTVEVEISPAEDAAGADPQLERAIAEALGALEDDPPRRPDLSGRPSTAAPPLPEG